MSDVGICWSFFSACEEFCRVNFGLTFGDFPIFFRKWLCWFIVGYADSVKNMD